MVEAAAEKTAAGRGPEPWVPGPGGVRAQPHLPVFPRDTVASSGSPPPEACRRRASCVNNCSLEVAKAALDSLWPPTAAAAKALQSCPTLCDPIDGSPPGSPVPGILQATVLEWVAIAFSSGLPWTTDTLLTVWLLSFPFFTLGFCC